MPDRKVLANSKRWEPSFVSMARNINSGVVSVCILEPSRSSSSRSNCGAVPASETHSRPSPRKQHTLRSAAEHYLYTRKPHFDTLRFDVIGILADRPEVRVHHIEDAF